MLTIVKWTEQYFKKHYIESPRLDAEMLLAFVCQCSRIDLYLDYDKPLRAEEREQFRELVKKRVQGMPVAYLMGEKGFWNLDLFVERGVLIPRPDTETLVEKSCDAIQKWQKLHLKKTCSILEIGTGTGAIPLALCSSLQNICCISVDVSEDALKIASKNLRRHSNLLNPRFNSLKLIQGNQFQMLSRSAEFDFIISNPPYIPTGQIALLQKEILFYEPKQALDGGEDGLDFYRNIFLNGVKHLKVNGELLLEIGYDQVQGIQALLPDSMELICIAEDLQSHPRVWHGNRLG
ncbi:MAG: peptide chain release factor N(5)-glutamine methyltransferase [SAR324 cluster bacterium]|nr:peptide chain release factor N(5)-glutamine methyltransferase [SAR324 cluster bacterium]